MRNMNTIVQNLQKLRGARSSRPNAAPQPEASAPVEEHSRPALWAAETPTETNIRGTTARLQSHFDSPASKPVMDGNFAASMSAGMAADDMKLSAAPVPLMPSSAVMPVAMPAAPVDMPATPWLPAPAPVQVQPASAPTMAAQPAPAMQPAPFVFSAPQPLQPSGSLEDSLSLPSSAMDVNSMPLAPPPLGGEPASLESDLQKVNQSAADAESEIARIQQQMSADSGGVKLWSPPTPQEREVARAQAVAWKPAAPTALAGALAGSLAAPGSVAVAPTRIAQPVAAQQPQAAPVAQPAPAKVASHQPAVPAPPAPEPDVFDSEGNPLGSDNEAILRDLKSEVSNFEQHVTSMDAQEPALLQEDTEE